MAKFLIVFIGGSIPEDKMDESIADRLSWMNNLGSMHKFIDGSPLMPEGETIINGVESGFSHDGNSINGYAVIEATDIEEALKFTKEAPQVQPQYGSAKAEIRPLQPIN